MKIVLQKVREAAVEIEGKVQGRIQKGVCLLVGVEKEDGEEEARYLAKKIAELRIFPDKKGKMNLSLLDVGGEVLAVSQFTLASSVKKGRRPSFDRVAPPEKAEPLFLYLVDQLKEKGLTVKTGVFGAMMDIHLTNEGPVTFILHKE